MNNTPLSMKHHPKLIVTLLSIAIVLTLFAYLPSSTTDTETVSVNTSVNQTQNLTQEPLVDDEPTQPAPWAELPSSVQTLVTFIQVRNPEYRDGAVVAELITLNETSQPISLTGQLEAFVRDAESNTRIANFTRNVTSSYVFRIPVDLSPGEYDIDAYFTYPGGMFNTLSERFIVE